MTTYGSGTGIDPPTVSAACLTLASLRAACRRMLASTTDWPNDALDAWIIEAIRTYSIQMPRRWKHTITLTTGTQTYAVPGKHGFHRILSIEYCTNCRRRHPLFPDRSRQKSRCLHPQESGLCAHRHRGFHQHQRRRYRDQHHLRTDPSPLATPPSSPTWATGPHLPSPATTTPSPFPHPTPKRCSLSWHSAHIGS